MATSGIDTGEGIPPDIIRLVARKAASKWKDLARQLPIASPLADMAEEIKRIENAHQRDIREQCIEMLTQWSTEKTGDAVGHLIKCLREIGQERLAQDIKTKVNVVTQGQNIKSQDQVDRGSRSNNQVNAVIQGQDVDQVDTGTSSNNQERKKQAEEASKGTGSNMDNKASSMGTERTIYFAHGESMSSLLPTEDQNQLKKRYNWIFGQLLELKDRCLHKDSTCPPITVAVLDSGLYRDHEIFKGRTIASFNHVTDEKDDVETDVNGHGTACAGVVSYFAPKCTRLVNIKVLPKDRTMGMERDLEEGLRKLLQETDDTDIVSISLGTAVWGEDIKILIKKLQKKKVVIFAAGNEGDRDPITTLQNAGGIAIGSCNDTGQRSDFSSKGDGLFCLAPGENIPCARSTSLFDYCEFNGTSIACPFVAAVASNVLCRALTLTKENERAKMRNVLRKTKNMREILKDMCDDPNDKRGKRVEMGYGILKKWDLLEDDRLLEEKIAAIYNREHPGSNPIIFPEDMDTSY